MTTIGTFTAAKDGFLQGKIKTLTLNLAKVTLEPVNSDHESTPAFRLFANGIELGAAWGKTEKESDLHYDQVNLDDPSFPAPVFANLIANEEGAGFSLIWTRPKRVQPPAQPGGPGPPLSGPSLLSSDKRPAHNTGRFLLGSVVAGCSGPSSVTSSVAEEEGGRRSVTGKRQERKALRRSRRGDLIMLQTLSSGRSFSQPAGYRVDLSRGERIGRVSSEWLSRPADERYPSLTDLHRAVKARADRSRARTLDSREMRVEASRNDPNRLPLAPPGAPEPVAPTHWSFGQLSQLVGAPAGYLRHLPAPIAGINLQYGLAHHRSEMVKTYTTDEGRVELRAVTGPDYGRIHDHELVEALMRIAGNGTGDTRWKAPGLGHVASVLFAFCAE